MGNGLVGNLVHPDGGEAVVVGLAGLGQEQKRSCTRHLSTVRRGRVRSRRAQLDLREDQGEHGLQLVRRVAKKFLLHAVAVFKARQSSVETVDQRDDFCGNALRL